MKNVLGLMLLGTLLFPACSTLKVTVDYDDAADFSKYANFEYYGWESESDKILNSLDKQRIESAFGNEFRKRGMEYVENGGDLIITLFIITEEKTKVTSSTTSTGSYGYGGYYGYGPRYGWRSGHGMGHSVTTYDEIDYQVGTLIIDVYDAKNQQLIWESIARGTVNQNTNNKEARINKVVAQIMKDYPAKPLETK
jgi:hypothetical protein